MDSGAGEHLFKASHPAVDCRIVPPSQAKKMISATNHVKTSIATDALNLPQGFTSNQRHVNIFNDKDLHMNLMSTGQICETGTDKVVFDDRHCDVVEL